MSVTQLLMKPGTATIPLRADTPTDIIELLRIRRSETTFAGFSLIYIVPAWAPLELIGSAGVEAASIATLRYITREGRGTLVCDGIESWLGDPDGKGDPRLQTFTGATFDDCYDFVRERVGYTDVTKGTYWSQAGTFDRDHDGQHLTARDYAALFNRHFSSEWRMNPDLTFDAGPADDLYGVDLAALYHPGASGNEPDLPPILSGTASQVESVEDYFNSITVVATDGAGTSVTSTSRAAAPEWGDPWHSATPGVLPMGRVVRATGDYGAGGAVGQATGILFFEPIYGHEVTLELDSYDLGLQLLGKRVGVWDPDQDIADETADMLWVAGQPCKPFAARCEEIEFGLPPGCGVYFRNADGSLARSARPMTDLTPYVDWAAERKGATVRVGRAMAGWERLARNRYQEWLDR